MTTIKYFCDGNTAKGYTKFIDGNFAGLDKIYGITSKSMEKVNKVLQEVLQHFENEDKELIYRADNPEWLGGMILPKKKIAIIDTQLFHGVQVASELILEEITEDTLKLYEEEKALFDKDKEKAYELYSKALKVHDEWEKPYIENMDFNKMNEHTKTFIEQLNLIPKGTPGIEKHRYLGAATFVGAVDHVLNQTDEVKNRIYIKGRPGSGKSTHLKKLARAAVEAGYEVETYHCGFDPNSLDMIIIRELDICTFDSTAPHEYFPQREGDIISDHYELFITKGIDERISDELIDIVHRYRKYMDEAKGHLILAKEHLDKMENLIDQTVDKEKVDLFLKTIFCLI